MATFFYLPSYRLLSAVALPLALGGVPAWALAPSDTYESLADQGGVLLEQGKDAEGADRLSEAYNAMPIEIRVSDLGKFIVVRASDAHYKAWEADAQIVRLKANQALLRRFFDDLAAERDSGHPTAAADPEEHRLAARLATIDTQLDTIAKAKAEAAAAVEAEVTEEEPPPVFDSPASPPPSKPDGLTIGLLAGGGALFVAGMALTIQGARFPGLLDASRQQALDQWGLDETPDTWVEHEQQQLRAGRALLGTGIALSVVGTGGLIWGSIRLTERRNQTHSFAPLRLDHGAGATMMVLF